MIDRHSRPSPRDGECNGELHTAQSQADIAGERISICVPSLREGHGAFQLFTEGDGLCDAMISSIEGSERDIGMVVFRRAILTP